MKTPFSGRAAPAAGTLMWHGQQAAMWQATETMDGAYGSPKLPQAAPSAVRAGLRAGDKASARRRLTD